MAVISNGTTLIDAGALDSGVATGSLIHIKTLTASSSANLSFVHGSSSVVLDGTYSEYIFKYINIHPASVAQLVFNLSTDSGSNYNVTKTTSYFTAYQNEGGSSTNLGYDGSLDLAQSTAYQSMANPVGNGNDESTSGTLFLFSPSSTTFVKHFICKSNVYHASDYTVNTFMAGYGNTTSAIDAVDFKMSSGNIDSGIIKMFGLRES